MELRIRESRERIINSTTTFSSTASTSNNNNNNITIKNKAIAQCNADASHLSEFEQSSDFGKSFNYSRSVIHAPQTVPEEQITAYLSGIQRGIVIHLEPALLGDLALSLAEVVQSQKLLARAISRLQSVPAGDIGVLCDTVVEDVQQLTGYDRVMVYKFHYDDHGEVVSETRRPDLEPYLGLHFPATDIPHAARVLFKQNRVRMICNCLVNPVRIIQSKELKQPLCLVNSTFDRPMLATRSTWLT
ncbi:Phytochrome E [Camellia lanceoleosa]|uniref:Phytochrome E n=1 Tax=Camellia lanceoleosa TaxID=1840588 RepID=A0ACC0GRB5_9ERIC|nr:Phytochrome E [Camellia lanceoleosa]